jgi:N-glycosylase/DNA lyase
MNELEINNGGVTVRNLLHFDPVHTFECGQCFRWKQDKDGCWHGIAKGHYLELEWNGRDLTFHQTTENEFKQVWNQYFDLDRDYGAIKEKLSEKDPVLAEAIRFGHGIRLLRQDFHEAMISFIISQNNGIPRIKKIIESLSGAFGEPSGHKESGSFSFPSLERLSALTLDELKIIRAGYRDKYIHRASQQLVKGEVSLEAILKGVTAESRKEMLKLFGVGEKVADCILLFSGTCYDIFPVDRWVKRVMAELYLGYEASYEELYAFALEKFGNLAGFAQQYLFYYAREKKIGM